MSVRRFVFYFFSDQVQAVIKKRYLSSSQSHFYKKFRHFKADKTAELFCAYSYKIHI